MSALLSNTASLHFGPEKFPLPITPLSPNSIPLRLLIVDASSHIRQICREGANSFGFVSVEVESMSAARKALERRETDILILDLTPSSIDARALLTEIKSLCPDILVIAMNASATIASAVETMQAGAFDYLSKPFPAHILTKSLERAATRRCFDHELRKLQSNGTSWLEMGNALGQSAEMEKLYRNLSRVADSSHPVMILGEKGTGKELVAKSIHLNGRDRSKPFVSIDCKSLSSSGLEIALFGNDTQRSEKEERPSKVGLLTDPRGGTVFLNEIGEISLELQRKLARAIRERNIQKEEGTEGIRLSVRIVAATSRDLIELVNMGQFRMDLFQSLSLMNLQIPPLRGRPEDIVFLAQRFLDKLAEGTGVYRTLSPETAQILKTYEWPENTEELENAIAEASAAASNQRLESDHLPRNIVIAFRAKDATPKGQPGRESIVPIAVMEQLAISNALRHTNGDRILAAQLLGIGKTTLYRKLKEYAYHGSPEPILSQSDQVLPYIGSNSDGPADLAGACPSCWLVFSK